MGTNLGLLAQMGKDIYFFLSLHHWLRICLTGRNSIMVTCWTLFTFVRNVLESGRLVRSGKGEKGSSLGSHKHSDILMIKPWRLWYLAALCLHAACGAQAFWLSLGPEGLGSLPLKPFSALARPCVTSSSIIPDSKKVHTSRRSYQPLPFLRHGRTALGFKRLSMA